MIRDQIKKDRIKRQSLLNQIASTRRLGKCDHKVKIIDNETIDQYM